MDVVPSDYPVMDMTNCVVRIHRLDLPLDVVVKVPLWDEEHCEESLSPREQGRSPLNSVLHEPVQEVKASSRITKSCIFYVVNSGGKSGFQTVHKGICQCSIVAIKGPWVMLFLQQLIISLQY